MIRVIKKKKYREMCTALLIGLILIFSVILFVNCSNFGRLPRGERLERVKNSPNYWDGKFQNIHKTQQLTSDKSRPAMIIDFLFRKKERLRPKSELPVVKTDLWKLDKNTDLLVWFGHSSYLLQTDTIRILADPVLCGAASPVSFFNKPFKGTDVYKPEDIPEIDYLILSHDHWDHLDYKTVKALKDRIGMVICGLGVGEHLERWGYDNYKIIELDWNENRSLNDELKVYCLPARHFSGRGFSPNQSLWASFLIETPSRKIFISGDGGYDTHFADIGRQFGEIDLAILENGQYDEQWKYIHLLPEQHIQAFKDLNAKRLFTVHHSKFALANHPWDEPLKNISSFAERDSINLILPMIGEPVHLSDDTFVINKWWEKID